MIEKSELDYLLEAADTTVNAVQLRAVVRLAIDLRKQDREKADAALLYTNREKLYMDTPQNVPNTADNTPKGGGDTPKAQKEAVFMIHNHSYFKSDPLVGRLRQAGALDSTPAGNDMLEAATRLENDARAVRKAEVRLINLEKALYGLISVFPDCVNGIQSLLLEDARSILSEIDSEKGNGE